MAKIICTNEENEFFENKSINIHDYGLSRELVNDLIKNKIELRYDDEYDVFHIDDYLFPYDVLGKLNSYEELKKVSFFIDNIDNKEYDYYEFEDFKREYIDKKLNFNEVKTYIKIQNEKTYYLIKLSVSDVMDILANDEGLIEKEFIEFIKEDLLDDDLNPLDYTDDYDYAARFFVERYGFFVNGYSSLHVASSETGEIIEDISDMAEGLALIEKFEKEDKENGDYEENFYDIVDQDHRSVNLINY